MLAELRYLTDGTPQVLPTFSSVAPSFHMTEPPTVSFPGVDIELSQVVHASEAVTVPAPLPPSGSARATTRITDIWDKGKAAVILNETTVTDLDGTPAVDHDALDLRPRRGRLRRRARTVDVRSTPDRAPDVEIDIPVLPQQALLYRLCGDRNPLHSDPGFARPQGFPGRSCTGCAPTA